MDFFTITSEMTQDLKLKGNNLLVYAIIYNYSKNGKGICTASRNYIKHLIGANSLRTVDSALEYLIKHDLIIKGEIKDKVNKFVTYKAVSITNTNMRSLYAYLIQDFSSVTKELFFNGIEWITENKYKLNINVALKYFDANWINLIDKKMRFWNIQKKTDITLVYGFKEA